MNAPELLATVTARGAVARCELDAEGAAVLVVAPRSCVVDLLPELARFKPALLELLDGQSAGASSTNNAARARVRPELRALMAGAEVLELGRLLLRLDAEKEIE